ncbi:MAG: RNA-binding domain-containing protein [Sulfolobaceae archaeon]
MKVKNLHISVFSHETENLDKIQSSIESNILSDFFPYVEKNITEVTGHYGNRIKILEYKVLDKVANEVFFKILNNLSLTDLIYLLSTLEDRFSKGKLYLRLDKQQLILNNITLKDGDDVVKVTVSIIGGKQALSEKLKEIVNSRSLRT